MFAFCVIYYFGINLKNEFFMNNINSQYSILINEKFNNEGKNVPSSSYSPVTLNYSIQTSIERISIRTLINSPKNECISPVEVSTSVKVLSKDSQVRRKLNFEISLDNPEPMRSEVVTYAKQSATLFNDFQSPLYYLAATCEAQSMQVQEEKVSKETPLVPTFLPSTTPSALPTEENKISSVVSKIVECFRCNNFFDAEIINSPQEQIFNACGVCYSTLNRTRLKLKLQSETELLAKFPPDSHEKLTLERDIQIIKQKKYSKIEERSAKKQRPLVKDPSKNLEYVGEKRKRTSLDIPIGHISKKIKFSVQCMGCENTFEKSKIKITYEIGYLCGVCAARIKRIKEKMDLGTYDASSYREYRKNRLGRHSKDLEIIKLTEGIKN